MILQGVAWRTALCYALVIPFGDFVSDALSKLDVHKAAALAYDSFASEPRVQQQVSDLTTIISFDECLFITSSGAMDARSVHVED
jgi:hypothetical protein